MPQESAFQSTLPARGATKTRCSHAARTANFNPRSPHGERRRAKFASQSRSRFQSTLPARGATPSAAPAPPESAYFNPRSPHGERHKARAEQKRAAQFQSTLPARGATGRRKPSGSREPAISIHAPRTGSDERLTTWSATHPYFNPRSPHGERRDTYFLGCLYAWDFNPRSPHGERPGKELMDRVTSGISIHAPRTGSDNPICAIGLVQTDFNPRSPHGERRKLHSTLGSTLPFQSTLPARGATSFT